jgi:hypothetical protein
MSEENENLTKAIADFNFNMPDAIELHNKMYEGFLFNCAAGNQDNLTEDVILYNRNILELLNLIKQQQKAKAQLN